jgi:hypothetical protein
MCSLLWLRLRISSYVPIMRLLTVLQRFQAQPLDSLKRVPKDVIGAKRLFEKLENMHVDLKAAMKNGFNPNGVRQECRFSLSGDSLRGAVEGILHVYDQYASPFYAFAGSDLPAGTMRQYTLSSEAYLEFVDAQFSLAHDVYERLFMGRANELPPLEQVFPLLADLINTLGLNFGLL